MSLNRNQQLILIDLVKLGAATPIQFEIKTNRIGLGVRNTLIELEELGLVKHDTYKGLIESEVFYPSPHGYREVR